MPDQTLPLAYLYARIADDRRFDEFHRVLAPHCRISGPGYVMDGLPAILQGMEVLRQYDRTFHLVGNHTGEWQGENLFIGETYCLASHIYLREGQEWKLDMAIRYQDRIERLPEGLRFAARELKLSYVQDLPLSMAR